MEILPIFLMVTAVVWAAVVMQRVPLLVFGLAVIFLGAIFGAEFFNTKIGPLPVTVDRVLWGILGLLILWKRLLVTDGPVLKLSPIDFVLAIFCLLIIASTFTHDWRRSDNLPLGRLLFFQLIPISFFWLGRHIPFKEEDLKRFSILGIGFGVYLALTGIAEAMGLHGFVFPQYIVNNENYEFFGRARGPFINPVGNGIVLVFSVGCCCQLWSMSSQSVRTLLILLITLITVGIYYTLTRSVWLGFCLAMTVVIWHSFPVASRGALIASASLAVIVFVFALAPALNHFKRDQYVSAEEMSQSVGLRPMLFAVAWEMSKEKPLFGHGYGQYKKVSAAYHRSDDWDMQLQTVQPYLQHNIFLAYLVELGVFGLLITLAIFGSFLLNSCRLVSDQRIKSNFRMLCLTVLIVNVNILVNGLFHDVSLIVVVGSLFFFVNGLAYAIRDRQLAELSLAQK